VTTRFPAEMFARRAASPSLLIKYGCDSICDVTSFPSWCLYQAGRQLAIVTPSFCSMLQHILYYFIFFATAIISLSISFFFTSFSASFSGASVQNY
jgi:hypothetical protein